MYINEHSPFVRARNHRTPRTHGGAGVSIGLDTEGAHRDAQV